MKKVVKSILPLFIVALVFTGCAHCPRPCPDDTVLSMNRENRPDWIDDEEVYRQEGLEVRNAGSFSNEELMRFAHNAPEASVYYGFDHSSITSKERQKLQDVATAFNKKSNVDVLVVGHCDWHGTEEYNMALGDRRARSAQVYLQELGVPASNIKTLSRGSFEAEVGGKPDQVWQDRRSDVIVMH